MKIWALSEAAIVIDPDQDRLIALQRAAVPVLRIFSSGRSAVEFRPDVLLPIALGLCAELLLFFLIRKPTP